MSEIPQISEIWTVKIYFKEIPEVYKTRPVIIVDANEENSLYTIQEITGVPPKNNSFFQTTKEEIVNWEKYGLDKKSFVKCSPTNTHKVHRVRLINKIGTIDEDEFEKIVDKIIHAKMSCKT